MEVKNSIFEGLDWVILGLYFAVLVGVMGSITEE